MIERKLLEDLGFVRGTKDWPHETWVYDGMFWVYFGDFDVERWPLSETTIDGNNLSRKEFLQQFLKARENEIYESMQEIHDGND